MAGGGPGKGPAGGEKVGWAAGGRTMHSRGRAFQPRHWRGLADRCGPGVWHRMLAMAESVDQVIDQTEALLPARFPSSTWRPIRAGMRRHAQRFLRAAKAVTSPRGVKVA